MVQSVFLTQSSSCSIKRSLSLFGDVSGTSSTRIPRSSWASIHQANGRLTATQQIGVHKALLCVLFVLEILCSSTKNNFCVDVGCMVCFSCVWMCFICVSFKITQLNIGFVCAYFEFMSLSCTLSTQNGFKSVHREHENFLNACEHQFVGKIS